MKGIDISVYQSKIDWEKVKNQDIEFAMVKASQGGKLNRSEISPFTDSAFEKNVRLAASKGIKCGAYHYLAGTTIEDVVKEAEFFVKTLNKVKKYISFPCAVDMEESRYTLLDKNKNATLIKAFCDVVKLGGYIPMLYTNRAFSTHFINMKKLKGIDVWYALYRKDKDKGEIPNEVPNTAIWQWGTDRVEGIVGDVDMNICVKDYDSVKPISVGDTVTVKKTAAYYYNGGPRIPSWVKGKQFRVSQTLYRGKELFKNGDRVVLLGELVDANGVGSGNIMSWISVNSIEK